MDQMTVLKERAQVRVNEFVRSVYNWMCIGLAVTGFTAWYVAGSPALIKMISGGILIFLFIATLGLVFIISGMMDRISAGTATGLFVLYSALMGVMLSSIFVIYTEKSIAITFFICSGTFLGCSFYGWTTKRDLTSIGGFLMMGLIGIVIASVVNIFMRSAMIYTLISYIGVFIFVGLTAYDTQKIKDMALSQPDGLDGAVIRKGAILGALSLYLDFINLFLMLLRFFGQSRD